jgi:hypothetical protein
MSAAASDNLVTIACDESGAEGENLMRSQHPVFVHASTDLTLHEADAFMDRMRTVTGSKAAELKSGTVLNPRHRDGLLDAIQDVEGRMNINFVDKAYYVTAKLISLLAEEKFQRSGLDIGQAGIGRQYAAMLHDLAPTDLGPELWAELLTNYNDFVRVYARAGAKPPTTEPFFTILEEAVNRAEHPSVKDLLLSIWDARRFAVEYEGARADQMREMDPMFSTMRSVSMAWRIRRGNVPMEFLADRYSTLTPHMCDVIVRAAQTELAIQGVALPLADLRAIRLTDSRDDARIQVADIAGGIGREISRLAHAGYFDDELQVAAREMLDFNGMWSDGSPLDVLYERRRPKYADDYYAELFGQSL